jgi:hypothetical protein
MLWVLYPDLTVGLATAGPLGLILMFGSLEEAEDDSPERKLGVERSGTKLCFD